MSRKTSTLLKERKKNLSKIAAEARGKPQVQLAYEDEIQTLKYKIHQYEKDLESEIVSKDIASQKIQMFKNMIKNFEIKIEEEKKKSEETKNENPSK